MCRALQTMALESLSWIHTTDAPCYRTFGSAADADDSVRRSIREMLAIRYVFTLLHFMLDEPLNQAT